MRDLKEGAAYFPSDRRKEGKRVSGAEHPDTLTDRASLASWTGGRGMRRRRSVQRSVMLGKSAARYNSI